MTNESILDAKNSEFVLRNKNKKKPKNDLIDRLFKIQKKNTSKQKNKVITTPKKPEKGQLNRGRAGSSLIQEAQLSLFEQELKGRFTKIRVSPESEFPTFLTRLPLFRPAKRSNQRDFLDEENAMPFVTPWGVGKKHGPPLTVYDEDTLIALGRLRQNCLTGVPHRLPLPIPDHYQSKGKQDVDVHVAQIMISDVQKMCDTELSGQANRMRLNSIKRLAATVIEFDNRTADNRLINGTSVKLIDVAWQYYEENGLLYVQFTPVMASWFENEYSYIDWKVRQKLSDTGKAVHRFLSGQPKKYQIFTKKLMSTIGYVRSHSRFIGDLRKVMDQLENTGWIVNWEIVGTGRSTPRKLLYTRPTTESNTKEVTKNQNKEQTDDTNQL